MQATQHAFQQNAPAFPTPDELRLWLSGRVGSDRRSAVTLARTIVPFLVVFFSDRRRDDLSDLVHQTLLDIHRHRASYDPLCPFSMWLLETTRQAMTEYFGRCGDRGPGGTGTISAEYHVVATD